MLIIRVLLLVSWYVASASAWFLTNVTVDDTDGDVATGAQFFYYPAESWSVRQNCTEAEIQTVCPNAENAYDKTWHAGAEYAPGRGLPGAEISFTGSALYVYCIVVPNLTTDLTFFIDGDTAGTYTQNANPYDAGIVQYNTLVYANDTIPWGTHTFTLLSGATADAQASTLAVLDYIVYTTRVDLSTSTDVATSCRKSKTTAVVAAVTVVGVVVLLALGATVFYFRKRPYKGYGPPVNGFFCGRGRSRTDATRAPVDLVRDGWDDRVPRNQRSTSSLRTGLLSPGHASRLQAPPPTLVSTGSTTSVNEHSVAMSVEGKQPVVESGHPVATPPPAASQASTVEVNGGVSAQARYGPHPTAPHLVVTIPQLTDRNVVAENASSSKTPPPLPPKGSPPAGAQKKWPPAAQRSTPPTGHHSTPPTAYTPPTTPPMKRGRRPKSEIASRPDGASFPRPPSAKRGSAANGRATPSTGQRISGTVASDRTTPSTPNSVAPSGFWMDNMSTPDLPARADSVKTVNTMPMTGRICDRLLGNVYIDTTPLPDMSNFSLRSDTGKSSDTASQSPGTAYTSSASPASNPSMTSPTVMRAMDALSPVPVVDSTRRALVDSPISLPNSPNLPLLAATLQIVNAAERRSTYSGSAVPPRTPLRPSHEDAAEQAPAQPVADSEGAPPSAPAVSVVISASAGEIDAPSSDTLRLSSPELFINAGSQETVPSGVEAASLNAPPEPTPSLSDAAAAPSAMNASHAEQHEPHPQAVPDIPSFVPQPESNGPLPSLSIPRTEGERLRKLPPVPLPLSTRLDTVPEDVVSPRFFRPLPRPVMQSDSDRLPSSSSMTSDYSVDNAEVAVGERLNVSSILGRSPALVTRQTNDSAHSPSPDVSSQSDPSEASSVSSRPVLTRENSTDSAGTNLLQTRTLDMNIPRFWSQSSPVLTESTPSVRALPLVPNRHPGVVLGTMLQPGDSDTQSSVDLPSRQSSVRTTHTGSLAPNRHPSMASPMGPRSVPLGASGERTSVPSQAKEKPLKRFGL